MNLNQTHISVALITRNRPESLERCLKSLRQQSFQPFEVIVSDDSDPEFALSSQEIVERWNCKYIRGPRRGMQANRNCAHSACQGTHIRTMDDDHEFPEDHFKIIQEVIESDPESVWVLSEYHGKPTAKSALNLPGEIQPRGFRKAITNFDDCFAVSDGAAIYPRLILEKHRFLEDFQYAGELEFGARLKALGYRIRYCPKTYIIHHCGAYHDSKLLDISEFVGAYLTYSFYFPSNFKEIECLLFYFFKAVSNSIQINQDSFNLTCFFQALIKARAYGKLFKLRKLDKMI